MILNKKAQNIIEFIFVFLVTMSIFLSVFELGLYWRAKHSVAMIADEVIANIQVVFQNTKSEERTLQEALQIMNRSAGLLNLENTAFSLEGSDGSYTIKSNYTKSGQSALVLFLFINNLANSDITATISYRYNGIFLFSTGKTITSSVVRSIQKF